MAKQQYFSKRPNEEHTCAEILKNNQKQMQMAKNRKGTAETAGSTETTKRTTKEENQARIGTSKQRIAKKDRK